MRVYHVFFASRIRILKFPEVDPDPDSAKWYESDRFRIRNTDVHFVEKTILYLGIFPFVRSFFLLSHTNFFLHFYCGLYLPQKRVHDFRVGFYGKPSFGRHPSEIGIKRRFSKRKEWITWNHMQILLTNNIHCQLLSLLVIIDKQTFHYSVFMTHNKSMNLTIW